MCEPYTHTDSCLYVLIRNTCKSRPIWAPWACMCTSTSVQFTTNEWSLSKPFSFFSTPDVFCTVPKFYDERNNSNYANCKIYNPKNTWEQFSVSLFAETKFCSSINYVSFIVFCFCLQRCLLISLMLWFSFYFLLTGESLCALVWKTELQYERCLIDWLVGCGTREGTKFSLVTGVVPLRLHLQYLYLEKIIIPFSITVIILKLTLPTLFHAKYTQHIACIKGKIYWRTCRSYSKF